MVNDMFAILDNRTLTFFAGMLSLILGLITVILHNYWTYDARMLITLFGWMAIAKGVVRIAFPDKLHKAISPLKKNKGLIRALLMTTAFAGVVLVAYSYLQQ